eukprot:TRINITY_DN14666_c0_g1_i1.p1 TRINITY_DN14666_c0_g1~~TRINITY_DN14666_c0_g1_i1.p1  ORF type:complete len:436 (+),score=62.35 TRINITY_DN14666_c0_g1_i1:104-1411(+)
MSATATRNRKGSPPPAPTTKATSKQATPSPAPKQPEAEVVPVSNNDPQERWARWKTRTKSTIAMLVGFAIIIYMGHLALLAFVFALQLFILKEVWDIRLQKLKSAKVRDSEVIPIVRALDWYLFAIVCYYIYGKIIVDRFMPFFLSNPILRLLAENHSMLSFWLFVIGFVGFVLTLRSGMYKVQFVQLAWTLATLVTVVFQTSLHVHNILEGLVWFFLPCGVVVINDIFAFIWGFSCGKTPLIQLSPKKTWEGFIGAIFSTWLLGFVLAYFMSQMPGMICPRTEFLVSPTSCVPDPVFVLRRYDLPASLVEFLSHVGIGWDHVNLYPFQLHTLALATFASIIAPFGGFFASGFKRAFKIKDFADTIPGHGGISDRMDCQIIMASFAYVYLTHFVKLGATIDPASVLRTILSLPAESQLEIYRKLQDALVAQNLLA